jgi:hypothetical protein
VDCGDGGHSLWCSCSQCSTGEPGGNPSGHKDSLSVAWDTSVTVTCHFVTVAWGTGQIHCSAADPDTSYLVGCQQRGKAQGLATVNREQTVLRRGASCEASAHRFAVLSVENGGDCCDREQEPRETSGEPPSVERAGLNSADSHEIQERDGSFGWVVSVPLVPILQQRRESVNNEQGHLLDFLALSELR